MDDASLVRRFERLRDLLRDGQRLIERNRSLRNAVGQCRPFDQLQHERPHAVRVFKPVDRGDIGVIEGGEQVRLAIEAGQAFRIAREDPRQDLDGDLSAQLRIVPAVDLAHAARAQPSLNLVGAELLTYDERMRHHHPLCRHVQGRPLQKLVGLRQLTKE